MHRYGIPIGHIGHLSQVPKHDYSQVIKMKPDVVTIYSLQAAQFLNDAAKATNTKQDILIKVADEDGVFLPGQESGILISEFKNFVQNILKLNHVNIVGLTAFPCVTYNTLATDTLKLTNNVEAIKRARTILETEINIIPQQINTPGNTSALTMPLFKKVHATHVEPGHGITGTTPVHLYKDQAPEIPALVYVSEISHKFRQHAYMYGGGLYVCMGGGPKDAPVQALVGKTYDQALTNKLLWSQLPLENIDYYGMLSPSEGVDVGDTTLMGFRPQMFITRANIAVVSDVHTNKPKVHGIFDSAGNMVDDQHHVISPKRVNKLIDDYLKTIDLL